MEAMDVWKKELINEHLIYINGVELIFWEFKELLLDLAIKLKDKITHNEGKLKSLARRFLEDHFLKRLQPFIKVSLSKTTDAAVSDAPVRSWPESKKDKVIKAVLQERAAREAEELRLKQAELARLAALEAEARAAAKLAEEEARARAAENGEAEPSKKSGEEQEQVMSNHDQ